MTPLTGNILAALLFTVLIVATVLMVRASIPWYYAYMPLYIPAGLFGLYAFLWFGWGYGGWFT